MLHLLVTLGLVAAVATSHIYELNRCRKIGGTCYDKRHHICETAYETGLCRGGEYIKCCRPCTSQTCLQDRRVPSNEDRGCTSKGGICINRFNYCHHDTFDFSLCGGSSDRWCCRRNPFWGRRSVSGNISRVQTTGASAVTAKQDRLPVVGVQASRTMAETDSGRMLGYKSLIRQAGQAYNVDPAVIAGIISRESRAGNVLDQNGYGDHGNGFGLMQVDKRHHTPQGDASSLAHLMQGAAILNDMINGVSRNHPTWTAEQKLKGGISAYNAGPGNVETYDGMDVGTTGDDYANDVVARAQYFKENGY